MIGVDTQECYVLTRDISRGGVSFLHPKKLAIGQCIELAYYGGLTYAEVSHQLSTNLSTIKSRMRDALRGLRGCLGMS